MNSYELKSIFFLILIYLNWIHWILEKEELKLSPKDTTQPKLNETNDLFEFGVNYYA